MGFEVSGLGNYTKENVDLLVKNSLFEARTQQLIIAEGVVLPDIKSSEKIGRMDTDAFFQSDSGCGFNASGTTEFTQRTLTVGKFKVNEILCQKDLEAKYLQQALRAGGTYDSLAFEADYTEQKAGKIAEALEVALWQANATGSAGSNGLLNKFDGLKTIIAAASTAVVDANVTGFYGSGAPLTGITTAAQAKGAVNAVIKALPAKIQGKSDTVIFCGWDVYTLLIEAYVDANLFHFNPGGNNKNATSEFIVPGTGYRVIPVHGLDNTKDLYAMRMSNIFLGTDLLGEENQFKLWYSDDDDNIKFAARAKMGIQLAFPDEVVKFEA
jgi:hypothetical protein